MNIARFIFDGKEMYGEVREDVVRIIQGDIYDTYTVSIFSQSLRHKNITSLLPLKVVCVGSITVTISLR